MPIEIGTAYVSIIPNTKPLEAGIRKSLGTVGRSGGFNVTPTVNTKAMSSAGVDASRRFNDAFTSDAERRGARIGQVVGTVIGRSMALAITGVVGLAGATLFKGFERYKSLDATSKRLSAMGKNADQVKGILADINSVIEGTPVALDAAAKAATNFVTAGMEGETLKKTLTAIADAAGASGANFDELATIFGQVNAKGKLSAEEINQLAEHGLNVLPLLREQFKDLPEDIGDAGLKIGDLVAVIESKFGGMAKRAADTVDGALGQLQTSIARVGANFLSAIFGDPLSDTEGPGAMAAAINNITNKINELNVWVTSHRTEIKQFFTDAANTAKDVAGAVRDVVDVLGGLPNAVKIAGAAFLGWEALKAVANLNAALQSTSILLGTTIPAQAGLAGTAIAALGPIGVAAAASIAGAAWLPEWMHIPGSGISAIDFLNGKRPQFNNPFNDPDNVAPSTANPHSDQKYSTTPPGLKSGMAPAIPGVAGEGFPFVKSGKAIIDIQDIGKDSDVPVPGAVSPSIAPGKIPSSQTRPKWGSSFGQPSGDWWLRPMNPDDYFFPDWWPPGMGGWWKYPNPREKIIGFDSGGWIQQGYTAVANKTGKPELVLNPDQVDALTSTLGAVGVDPADVSPHLSGRTQGYMPAVATGNTGVAGTSSLASILNLGNEAIGGLIDTGASMAKMAISAAATAGAAAGTSGAAAAAGPAASAAAGYGIDLAAAIGKRGVSYGFQMASILADAGIEQLFLFGAPRWLGYDYTAFAPQLGIQQALTTTAEKALSEQLEKAFGGGASGASSGDMASQIAAGYAAAAGGPVHPSTMPGANQPTPPPPKNPYGASFSGGIGAGLGGGAMPGVTAPSTDIGKLLGIYDQGGMLQPGSAAVNLSSQPEYVLTPQQWDSIQAAAPARGNGANYYVYATNTDEAVRELRKNERRNSLRYSARSGLGT